MSTGRCGGKILVLRELLELGSFRYARHVRAGGPQPPHAQAQSRQLTGTWPTYGGGQKPHFHPQLTPDRRWILFTAGDPRSRTTHMFLLDVADLQDSVGISAELLSPTGENDLI